MLAGVVDLGQQFSQQRIVGRHDGEFLAQGLIGRGRRREFRRLHAVGGLSWAAVLDSEARVETFGETLDFLKRQRPFLEQATSAAEFDRLLLETETILLGETTNWFSRRSNTGLP